MSIVEAIAPPLPTSSGSRLAQHHHDYRGGGGGRISTTRPKNNNNEEQQKQQNPNEESSLLSEYDNTDADIIMVTKRDGTLEPLDPNKIRDRLQQLSFDLDTRFVHVSRVVHAIVRGMYPNITSDEIDILAAETAAGMSTFHPDYNRLAARIAISHNHKLTPNTFSQAMKQLKAFLSRSLNYFIQKYANQIDAKIHSSRDTSLTYFGFKTLERSYLLKNDQHVIVERPQYMLMRVALGIHCSPPRQHDDNEDEEVDVDMLQNQEDEESALQAAFETYDMMSRGLFMHTTPALFHSGTIHSQLSSCFLLQISQDSIDGIYDSLKRCAAISKTAGGIGMAVHNIRARGTSIAGTRGTSNGLVPMLRVYDVASRHVDQGGQKRPGAFSIYFEPWHADVFDILNLKKNHGKEEQRARDLFYGLWIPDLFMERVKQDGIWSLMCPHICPGLQTCYGDEFRKRYESYEREGKFVRQVRARELWAAILDAQIETGTPYLLYKDAANQKSNQKHLGTIQCSNLCSEIIQYTDKDEVAVCNLANLCLAKFVKSDRGPFGSIHDSERAYFDHDALHHATKVVTRNLDKIIDINRYPVPGAKLSNCRHRPSGIGVSGLADAFIRLGLGFASPEAKRLNKAIFETIYHAALEASVELAQKHGSYESFPGSPASKGILQFDMWDNDDDMPSQCHNEFQIPRQVYPKQGKEGGYNWKELKRKIQTFGLRNSLLVAPMPTASTSQILGVNECFEPFSSNMYIRRVKAGEFIMVNPHLLQDLTDAGLWTPAVRNQLMRDGGSVADIDCIPPRLKEIYKTVWEIKMKDIIDMAADRGKFVDQSQSLNLFLRDPTFDKLTAMHFYSWKKGLKTGMYYLRTKPAVNAIQYTVERNGEPLDDEIICTNCSS